MDTYELWNLDTDEMIGAFAILSEARAAARKLRAYAIWNDARRVEFCDPHPSEFDVPEDTPCLERPWWETER